VGACAAAATACTFPDFVVHDGMAKAGAEAGGGGTSSAAAGAAAGGAVSTAGSEPDGADAGAAGVSGSVIVQTAPWSASSVDGFGFSLLGQATLEPDGVNLTHITDHGETGAIVQRQELDFALEPTLHIAADFRIQPGTTNGDGLAVMIHAGPNGYKTLGSGGGGLGYGGIEPCVAVELDTAEVAATDFPAPHLGLMLGCVPERQGPWTMNLGGDPSDGKDWILSIDWDASTTLMNIVLRNVATGHETTISEPVDLLMLLGPQAFVAVSSATGEFRSTHSLKALEVSGGGLSPRRLE
jgi:hypothetical protein